MKKTNIKKKTKTKTKTKTTTKTKTKTNTKTNTKRTKRDTLTAGRRILLAFNPLFHFLDSHSISFSILHSTTQIVVYINNY